MKPPSPSRQSPPPTSPPFIFAVIRGDTAVNETKLADAAKTKAMRPATEAEIPAADGAEPGYGSPLGVRGALIAVDESSGASPNLVAGANEVGYHLREVNYGCVYSAHVVPDIAAAQESDGCPVCGEPLFAEHGVEVDNIAEMHHDDYGPIWPITIAPYPVHLLTFGPADSETNDVAEQLYPELQAAGLEVLFDDRDRKDRGPIPLADVIPVLKAHIAELETEIVARAGHVPCRQS